MEASNGGTQGDRAKQQPGSETQPLAGLKVDELGTLIAGPFCTRIMARFTEVIKIESPDGGDPRTNGATPCRRTSATAFVQAQQKSVTANLKHPDGREFVRRLIAEADILVRKLPPRRSRKTGPELGLLKADNPGLVMVHFARLNRPGRTG